VKEPEPIGNIDEIIGVTKKEEEESKTPGKTSIMTTSTGKTLKRKHDDAETIKSAEADIVCILDEEQEPTEKKLIMEASPKRPEISIIPIPKDATKSINNGKDAVVVLV